jgi:hypothetical protein
MPLRFDQLAEGLARNVHVAKDLAAGAPPSLETTLEDSHVRVAERAEAPGCATTGVVRRGMRSKASSSTRP